MYKNQVGLREYTPFLDFEKITFLDILINNPLFSMFAENIGERTSLPHPSRYE